MRLFTYRKFLNQENRKHVFPLLFDLVYQKNIRLNGIYELVDDVIQSDIVVIPIDINAFKNYPIEFEFLIELSNVNNKPLWYYLAGDSDLNLNLGIGYQFRLGGFRSKHDENVIVIPSFIQDPYINELDKNINFLSKTQRPKIGFVGHADDSLWSYSKSIFNYFKLVFQGRENLISNFDKARYFHVTERAKILKLMLDDNRIITDFIFRKKYRGNKFLARSSNRLKTSKEFFENIEKNIFTFCMRGVGNFSVRFFQVLAVGRIPVLMDTDCPLPLSKIIDWNRHVLILSKRTNIIDQILDFFDRHNNEEIIQIQKNNRQLWKTHLERINYFIKINQIFTGTLDEENY